MATVFEASQENRWGVDVTGLCRLYVSAAAALAMITSASAADIYTSPASYDPPSPSHTSFNWTGFYAGVHGGFGSGAFDYPWEFEAFACFFGCFIDIEAAGSESAGSSGHLIGAQVGYNWQTNDGLVFGIEADLASTNISGSRSDTALFDVLDVTTGSKVDWLGTLRFRAGFLPAERLLVYATGGWAMGGVEHYWDVAYDLGITDGSFGDSVRGTQSGWALGGGAEYALTDNITVRAEYLHVDLGRANMIDWSVGSGSPDCGFLGCFGAGAGYEVNSKTSFHTVKVGLNFLW